MKSSPIAAVSAFAALVFAAAGCGGHGSGFTPATGSAPGAAAVSAPREPLSALGAPPGEPLSAAATALHGVFFTINDSGYAPFELYGFGASATADAAPSTRLDGRLAALLYPQGVGLDHYGYAYVAESYADGSSSDPYEIAVYAPPLNGDKAPVRTIAGTRTILEGTALAVTEQGAVYVANGDVSGGGYVTIFEPGVKGDVAPNVLIYGAKTLLDQPVAIALGPTGKIYVANLGGGEGPATVTIYAENARGDVAPLDHFNLALQSPTAIAVDKTGAVYVASSFSGGIWVYAAGSHAPRAILGYPLRGTRYQLEPFGLAVDDAGYVYVANDAPTATSSAASQILVYAPAATNASKPIATIAGGATGLTDAKGVAVAPFASVPTPSPSPKPTATPTPTPTAKPTATPTAAPPADQAMYVADLSSKSLLGFIAGTTGSATPVVDITGSNTYFEQAQSAFADAKGNMWVAEQLDSTGSSAVLEFKAGANGNAAPVRRIYGQGPNGAADAIVDDAGNIYVLETNESQLAVFAPTANGQASPVRTVTSSYFNSPYAMAFDPAQKNIYIAQTDGGGNPEVLLIPVTAKGNVTPQLIYTNAYAPNGSFDFTGISLDRSGNLYVGGSPVGDNPGTIFELPAGKTGNVTPLRVLTDAGITQPTGVGVDAQGLIYVANFPQLFGGPPAEITVYKPGSSAAVRTITNAGLKLPGIARVGPYVK